MKTYLWRIMHDKKPDVVGIVTTKNILQYLYDFCKNDLDKIEGFEYQEITNEKEQFLCGDWVGVEVMFGYKNLYPRDSKGRFVKRS